MPLVFYEAGSDEMMQKRFEVRYAHVSGVITGGPAYYCFRRLWTLRGAQRCCDRMQMEHPELSFYVTGVE